MRSRKISNPSFVMSGRRVEGVHEGAEVGEASCRCGSGSTRSQGEEKAGTDVGLEQEAQVVEGMLPARAAIPVGMNEERRAGRWLGAGPRRQDSGERRGWPHS